MSKGSRVITGGTKEFVYSKGELKEIESEETSSSKEFKKALYINRFFNGKAPLDEVRKYSKFFRLRIIDAKGRIRLFYQASENKFKEIPMKKRIITLPKGRYKLVHITSRLFLFQRKQAKLIELDHDMDVEF